MQAYHAARTSDEKATLFRHMASLIPNPEELPDALKRFQETSSSSSAEVRGITTKSNPESMLPSSSPHVISSATQKSGPQSKMRTRVFRGPLRLTGLDTKDQVGKDAEQGN